MAYQSASTAHETVNFCVIGLGYVGTSLGVLLANRHSVAVFDIDAGKIERLNSGHLPISDPLAKKALSGVRKNIRGYTNAKAALSKAQAVIICTPTNFDTKTGRFDTSSVETSIGNAITYADNPEIVIKSTVPIGFTERARSDFEYQKIYFSPEFLREGSAYSDNMKPSRIIVGDCGQFGRQFCQILSEIALNDPHSMTMSSTEAETVKLMSNSYLAMRVAFFNEVDTLAQHHGLNTRNLIDGICSDPRISRGYNNPSFGYGGYCLPKDTNQLMAEYDGVPQNLVSAIVASNDTRIEFLAQKIAERAGGGVIGIHRLLMKTGSDNIRSSSSTKLLMSLKKLRAKLILFEPKINEPTFSGIEVDNTLKKFKNRSDLIVANRAAPELLDVSEKTFTRDIFNEN